MSGSALLIDNPNAGRLGSEARGYVREAVGRRLKLDVVATTERGAAIDIARSAAAAADLVIAFGGDGHVNEVVNGVAGSDAPLGIIPGGTMNVFARSLGIPADPMEAVEHLHAALDRPPRRVNLGRMDDRLFTFSAGCGFDAEAAERVERDPPAKRRFGQLFFYWSAFRVLTGSYRHRNPSMILTGPFGRVPVAMAIACNAGPYAYLHNRSIAVAPRVALESGLDVFALRKMRLEALPLYAWRCVIAGDLTTHDDAFYDSDLGAFEIEAEAPFKRHVDGEPVEPSTRARFEIARDALLVRA